VQQVNRLAGIATCVHCLLPPTWVPIQMSPPAMSPTAAAARGDAFVCDGHVAHVAELHIKCPVTHSFGMYPPAEADERHNLLTEDAQNLMVSDARRGGAQALSQH
jgi:hypothetical protein